MLALVSQGRACHRCMRRPAERQRASSSGEGHALTPASSEGAAPPAVTSRVPLRPLDWGSPALEVACEWPVQIQVGMFPLFWAHAPYLHCTAYRKGQGPAQAGLHSRPCTPICLLPLQGLYKGSIS